VNLATSSVGLLHGRVPDTQRGAGDIRTDAVTLDESGTTMRLLLMLIFCPESGNLIWR
jgi:hypothetical protein